MELLFKIPRLRISQPDKFLTKEQKVAWCLKCADTSSPEGPLTFITNFCRTVDEHGRMDPIPHWPHIEEFIAAMWEGTDLHVEKTRQMTITWTACAFMLWELQFKDGYLGFMTSRKEKLVDDGGDNSSPNSLLGKVRFLYNKLPLFLKREITFTFLKAECAASNSYIVGESANPDMGRGNTFARALGDEWSRVPKSETCFSALRSACPRALMLVATPWGPTGNFARIKKEKNKPGQTFKYVTAHWLKHPARSKDAELVNGKWTSSWYRTQEVSLTPDALAREVDINYSKSLTGLVYPQFDVQIHVKSRIRWDAYARPFFGVDFGITAATAAVFGQVFITNIKPKMRIMREYHKTDLIALDNAKNFVEILRSMGYLGPLSEVWGFGDPAGNAREQKTGSSVISDYRAVGLRIRTKQSRILDGVRAVQQALYHQIIEIDEECVITIDGFGEYRARSNHNDEVIDDLPAKGPEAHIMDAVRYPVLHLFPAQGSVNHFYDDALPARQNWSNGPLTDESTKATLDLYDRGPLVSGHRQEF